jgi:hypothetical protein
MTDDDSDIGSQRAVEIANEAIAGKAEVNATSTVTVEKRSQNYVVTYLRHNPPDVLAADYDARVIIDARTGEVLELLGAS